MAASRSGVVVSHAVWKCDADAWKMFTVCRLEIARWSFQDNCPGGVWGGEKPIERQIDVEHRQA
jgi:hypothetical protein